MNIARWVATSKNVAALVIFVACALLFAALAVSSSARAAGQSVPVAQRHAATTASGSLLLAGAGGGRIWLTIPIWLHHSGVAKNGFVLLDHPVNRRAAGGLLWQQFAGGSMSGTPQALAAVKASRHNVPTAGAYVFFADGVQARYTRLGHEVLPSLPGVTTTAAAVGCHAGVFALVYGPRLPPVGTKTPGTPAAVPAPGARPGIPAGKINATHGARNVVGPAPQRGAEGQVSPGKAAQHGAVAPSKNSALRTVVPVQKKRLIPTAVAKGIAPRPTAKALHWRVVRFVRSHWRPLPAVPFAKLNQAVLGRATLDVVHGRLLVAWTTTAASKEIFISSIPLGMTAGWTPPQILHVPAEVGQMALLSPDGHGMLFWISAQVSGAPMLNSARVEPLGRMRPARTWHAQALASLSGVKALARNCALSVDSNSIMVASRPSHTNKVVTETFTPAGRVASPVALVRARPLHQANPDLFQNLVLLSLMLVLGMFLWQRRQRAATLVLPPEIRIASLSARLGAAAIDVFIPLIIVAVVFHLGQIDQWVTVMRDWIRLPVAPERVFKDYPLLLALGLYTLHVMVSESISGGSIGKWIMRIRVVQADGKKAAPGPVIVRNITRPLEIMSGLFLFIFVSEQRQRLGDLLAQTLVVEKNRVIPEAQKVNDDDDDEDEESELLKSRSGEASS